MNKKLFRAATVPMYLKYLLKGQMAFMSKNGFNGVTSYLWEEGRLSYL